MYPAPSTADPTRRRTGAAAATLLAPARPEAAWPRVLGLAGGYFAVAVGCNLLARLPGNVATLWLGNALAVGVMLQWPQSRVPSGLAIAAFAGFAANLATQLVTDTGPQAPTPTGAAAAASARAAVDTTERPAASSVKTAAPQPNTGDGLDLTSLLFGSEATKSAIRSIVTVVVSLAFGYLWGKNRVLERQARNA